MLLEGDIRRGLAARQSLRFIYETHQAALSFGYIQFTKYVKGLIKTEDPASRPQAPDRSSLPPHARPAPSPVIPLASSPNPSQPRQAPLEETRRFHFDPMAVDSKDLI
jgi:hypothetical protein